MLNVAIVEDQDNIAEQIRTYVERYAAEHGLKAVCTRFASGAQILTQYEGREGKEPGQDQTGFDIVLLDINFDGPEGLKETQPDEADGGSRKTENTSSLIDGTRQVSGPARHDVGTGLAPDPARHDVGTGLAPDPARHDVGVEQSPNGMETARQIRAVDRKVVIAFITSLVQYAVDGYAVDAMDFIVKPVEYSAFALRFARMVQRVSERTDVRIQIQTNQGLRLISIGEIRYLETLNRLLYYHMGGGVTFASRTSLREAQKDLTRGHFVKCNQCYLVNLAYVNGVQGDQVNVDGELLDMSRRCKTPFLAALGEYLGGVH